MGVRTWAALAAARGDEYAVSMYDVNEHFVKRYCTGDASAETCSELCAGWSYAALQWADHCFCDNTYGRYAQCL